ncbi:pentatricopeptide repeat-containing protein At2g33680-like isoform X2 [Selaginella moellendorffii]|uniref:pentatricopeptide repeat-containing protein At2g33680-like isoform X2 n=1 Tax=Selaginella moellendorffii TaxID=88036 RepID=UPI000D1CDFF9|nr:pentatricopeptide repeat-containing protein At2g33680-like isoform X2 [Selaginella moellendorffii]|eukprot:XP_024523463.1 pentatricopeptide repeat-containing protein At2g33680-like isoform X2 [Selaginella moellendorffii]
MRELPGPASISENSVPLLSDGAGNAGKNRLLAALKACSRSRDLRAGKALHLEAIRERHDSDTYVLNSLVNMYAKCGSMADARRVFDRMSSARRTVVSWNSLLLGYAENGEEELCLEMIAEMVSQGWRPDALTFVAAIKACTKMAMKELGRERKMVLLERGRDFHAGAAKFGFDRDAFVSSSLVNFYARCGSMEDARKVFDERGGARGNKNVVSWNSLLLGYVDNEEPESALELFSVMQQQGLADSLSFVAALKASSCLAVREQGRQVDGRLVKVRALERGKFLHLQARKSGCELENFVSNSLIDMYAKCWSMAEAREVFERMPDRSVVSWNALLLGYVENGEGDVALELFALMRPPRACQPNGLTYVAALKACSTLARSSPKENGVVLEKITALRSRAAEAGFTDDNFVANTLVDVYAKCGSLADAKMVFDKMPCPDVVSWNAMILGYAENGKENLALEMFGLMRRKCPASSLSFVAALKACTSLALREDQEQEEEGKAFSESKAFKAEALEKGKAVHFDAVKSGLDSDGYVASSLVNMYCKCGSITEARKVFHSIRDRRSLVSWNILLLGLTDNGEASAALELFSRMLHDGLLPNPLSFAAVLKACVFCAVRSEEDERVRDRLLKKGRNIHFQVLEAGYDSDICLANTLVDFYAKCGSLEEARKVFDTLACRSLVSWTSLMLGYVDAGRGDEALELFARMQTEGCEGDALTLVAALKACAIQRKLSTGKALHSQAAKHEYDSKDVYVASALISMYSNCGSLADAQRVFDKAARRDVVVWNSLLLGYAENGDPESALALFTSMQELQISPNAQTYGAAIKACSRLESLRGVHASICRSGLEDNVHLATGLVDVYGKSGSLVSCRLFFETLGSSSRDLVTWNSVIAGHSRLGEAAAVEDLFHMMLQQDGLRADGVTFVSLLSACNHAGLVAKGKSYFKAMSSKYGVTPVAMVEAMAYEPDAVTWMTLLSACSKWRNLEESTRRRRTKKCEIIGRGIKRTDFDDPRASGRDLKFSGVDLSSAKPGTKSRHTQEPTYHTHRYSPFQKCAKDVYDMIATKI